MRPLVAFIGVFAGLGAASAGEIRGVLHDAATGMPLPSATVTIASSQRQLTVATDTKGRYAFSDLPAGEYGVLIALGGVHVQHASISLRDDETVELEDKLDAAAELITVKERSIPDLPAEPPMQKRSHRRTLPYSDEAFEKDVWGVAWLLLDVDATGHVTAAKFYRRPGYGLDAIALAEAWKLTFTPGLDKHGQPARSWVMFKMEWPPLSVHADLFDTETTLLPRTIQRLPCEGSGQPINFTSIFWFYRNCAQPDLAVGARERWQVPPGSEP